ncbi:hypothetical protein K502DRAFT_358235 [Neoconidiobolus thromboides FSU 785]|nr:hypothetical protein K502DRAFT_358235 [Neoconidiobolus thromboides FSU 785]
MGGYEHIDPAILTKDNTIFYIAASINTFFCAPIIHLLSPIIALFIRSLTYVFYTGSLLGCFHSSPATFYDQELLFIVGSSVSGIGSSLYWVTQAALLLNYSNEFKKGTCFSQMWDVYATGGMIGGFVYLGINYTTATSSYFSAFILIIVLMSFGALLALAIKGFPKTMAAENIPVEITEDTTLLHELIGSFETLFNFKLLLLIPFSICTN